MPTDRNTQVAERFINEVCNARKLNEASELFTQNCVHHDPSIPNIKPGPGGITEAVSVYQTAFPDAKWNIRDVFSSGDKVTVRWTGVGTHNGELKGEGLNLRPTGKKVNVEGVYIFRIDKNQIAE
ncbi:MAG: ester cyclase, partial [Syntrophothermus sp.]